MENGSPTTTLIEVDAILHPRWLLPMTTTGQVLEQHSLVVHQNHILDVAPTTDIKSRYWSAREFALDSHAVMPGLINAHGHAPMSLLRGFADDLPLHPWLEQKIWPAEARWLSEAFVADGARLAIAEMLLSGTTCFSDMYFFPDQIAAVVGETGIRAQLSSPVFDFPTLWALNADEYISKATRLHDQYRNSELITVAFGPHAPYTVSDAPLMKLATLAEELDVCIHMHVHENAQEVQDAIRDKGLRPLSRLKHLGLLSPRLQCIHMTQLLDDEIALLAEHGVSVVHCPASNLKLASGFSRVSDLLAAGVNVAIGTDSCASNNNLDMFSELRLASLLAKGVTGDAAKVPAFQALQMATINGARAMGMEEKLGTLEAGKLADLIAIDLDKPNTQPVYNVISTLAYSANSSQVSHVWVHGELLVEAGELVRMNKDQLLTSTREWGKQIGEAAQS
ncbi:MAG: TRZ/ATZ family hydrolase [Pseudomonadota bacterium]